MIKTVRSNRASYVAAFLLGALLALLMASPARSAPRPSPGLPPPLVNVGSSLASDDRYEA
jgi:hypothetical protein